MHQHPTHQDLARLKGLLSSRSALQAEVLALTLLESFPQCTDALAAVAECAAARDDLPRAILYLTPLLRLQPDRHDIRLGLAQCQIQVGAFQEAVDTLRSGQHQTGYTAECWLFLGLAAQKIHQSEMSIAAWFRAISQAQRHGQWLNQASTPPHLMPLVQIAMSAVQSARPDLLYAVIAPFKTEFGSASMGRVEMALAHYLGAAQHGPTDARQHPKFLYCPDLPCMPFHDPNRQPWANALRDGYADIRDEALNILAKRNSFQSFLDAKPGADMAAYVSGDGESPAWDAYFFYRHGKRFDAHHLTCPKTSAILESIDLCRIKAQTPEVCFSLLAPGSRIMPHYGVTNTRLVMHLPLLIPKGCALNILDVGTHEWKEGELMMFDDTFQHEAWNDSDQQRLILLMDCWNPFLSTEERIAFTALIERISAFENDPL